MKAQFNVDATQSRMDWEGRKVTGAHNGTINIKEGQLVLEDGRLTGGSFVIDVASIRILDVTDPATNAQFAGHLASDDFFAIAQYPEAFLTITSVVADRVTGDLTIKGNTHPVHFNMALAVQGDSLQASAKIVVDRTLYGIRFRSGNFFQNLGDTLIYNDFDLNVNLTAKALA